MNPTHWRAKDGKLVLIADMSDDYKTNVASFVSNKYGFRSKLDTETLSEYLGQLLLWLECIKWSKINSENYGQN